MVGPSQCCGVYHFREGDFANTGRVGYTTIDGLAAAGTSTVLSWCPSCQLQIGEVALPSYETRFGARPFDLNPFLVFLADHAETLARLMKHRVGKRVALHERPVLPAVQAAVRKLLSIIPGVELVEIDVPRVGTQANSLAVLPVIGLGTWRAFDVGADAAVRRPLREVLRLLLDAGGRMIDSSPMYGRAEAVTGDLLAEQAVQPRVFLATKVWTTGRERGIEQMRASAQLLRSE